MQLVSFRRSPEVKEIFSLAGAANPCDTSCRTDVTLRNAGKKKTCCNRCGKYNLILLSATVSRTGLATFSAVVKSWKNCTV